MGAEPDPEPPELVMLHNPLFEGRSPGAPTRPINDFDGNDHTNGFDDDR